MHRENTNKSDQPVASAMPIAAVPMAPLHQAQTMGLALFSTQS